MLFKSEPHYATTAGTSLVSFNSIGEYETEDEKIIEALSKNPKVKSEKTKEKKEEALDESKVEKDKK